MNHLVAHEIAYDSGGSVFLPLFKDPLPVSYSLEPYETDGSRIILQNDFIASSLAMKDTMGFDGSDNSNRFVLMHSGYGDDIAAVKVVTWEIEK